MAEPTRKQGAAQTGNEGQRRGGVLPFGTRNGGTRRRKKPRGTIRGALSERGKQTEVLRIVVP